MLEEAARDLNIDLQGSAMIGDSLRDIGAARAMGIAGYGRADRLWLRRRAIAIPARRRGRTSCSTRCWRRCISSSAQQKDGFAS